MIGVHNICHYFKCYVDQLEDKKYLILMNMFEFSENLNTYIVLYLQAIHKFEKKKSAKGTHPIYIETRRLQYIFEIKKSFCKPVTWNLINLIYSTHD